MRPTRASLTPGFSSEDRFAVFSGSNVVIPEPSLKFMSSPYVKDPVPLPRPELRSEGLTAFLRGLAPGESGTVPRPAADDVSKIARTLSRVYVTRVLDEKRARVWRVA